MSFDNITAEVHPDNPRFDDQDRLPTPIGAFEFHNSYKSIIPHIYSDLQRLYLITGSLRNYLEVITIHGGLDLLYIILVDLKPNDREILVRIMQRSIVSSYIPSTPPWEFSAMLSRTSGAIA